MRKIKPYRFFSLWALILCLGFFTNSYSQKVSEHVTIDSLQVGDTFDYAITLDRSEQYDDLIFPDSADFGSSFEIRSRKQYQVSTYKDSISYELQFFGTADTTIPQLPVILVQEQDSTVYYTNPVPVRFKSIVAEEEQEFRPLKPIFYFASAWWPYILGTLILLIAGYLFYKNYWQQIETKEPKDTQTFKPQPFVNPLKELRKAIKKLEQSTLSSPEDFKTFYIDLGDAIRRYYEDLHHIPALESTSRELIAMLEKRAIDKGLIADTKAVLQEADMVKFAKFTPTTEQADRALNKAHNFLDRAREVDGPRIDHLRRKHHVRIEAERERFNREQENEEVTA